MRTLWIAPIAVVVLALNWNKLFRKKYTIPPQSGGNILITGTSSGVGRATCGWLAVKYPETDLYCGVRKKSDAVGHPFNLSNVKAILLDVTMQVQVEDAMQELESTERPLIGLINNAGVGELALFEFIGVARLRHTLEVNVVGTYRVTQAALPMIRQAQGRIVFVGSASALLPTLPMWSAYVAAKAALEVFGDALRKEVAAFGVSVSMIEPGFIETEMVNRDAGVVQQAIKRHHATDSNEAVIYPHIGPSYLTTLKDFTSHTGEMDETCASIEHAIFDKYPLTRYATSRIGALPVWLTVKLVRIQPDRLFDWFADHIEIFCWVASLRARLERILGFT